MSEPKRFEEWTKVDCNECANYWNDSCDGSQGSEKPCNSFLASRSVILPAKIKRLESFVISLSVSLVVTDVLFIIHLLQHLLGW